MKCPSMISKLLHGDKLYYFVKFSRMKNKSNFPEVIKKRSQKRMSEKEKYFNNSRYMRLDIRTPEGMDQCVHPDIIEVSANNYLMVITPYPFGHDKLENPVIYRSSDLRAWEYVAGPIDSSDGGLRNHMSDPTIMKDNEGYKCIYRECIYDSIPQVTNIYMKKSWDGIHWDAERKLVFSGKMQDCDVLSPSICKVKEESFIYACLKQNNEICLALIKNMDFIYSMEKLDIKNMPDGKIPWHVSAIPCEYGIIFLLTLSDGLGGKNSELYIALGSQDESFVTIQKKLNIKR